MLGQDGKMDMNGTENPRAEIPEGTRFEFLEKAALLGSRSKASVAMTGGLRHLYNHYRWLKRDPAYRARAVELGLCKEGDHVAPKPKRKARADKHVQVNVKVSGVTAHAIRSLAEDLGVPMGAVVDKAMGIYVEKVREAARATGR